MAGEQCDAKYGVALFIGEWMHISRSVGTNSPRQTIVCVSVGDALRRRVFPVFFMKREMKGIERKLRVGELAMRLATFGFAVTASALVGSDREVKMFFSLEKRAKFTNLKVLVFLVAANGISAGYNLLQLVRCFVRMMTGGVLFGKGYAFVVFSCDQIIAYVALSAMAAAAQAAFLALFGQQELHWMNICNLYSRFCRQAGEGIACAFIACLAMVIISCISAFNFFRLIFPKKKLLQALWG